MKTYSEYKDSGIDWIGKIPKEWNEFKLKWILSSIESGRRDKDSINLENGCYSLGGEHIGWNCEIDVTNPRYISEEFYNSLNTGRIKCGDVLLVKDGATIGKCAIFEKELDKSSAVNEHVFILRKNKKIFDKFLFYFTISEIGQKQISLCIRGSAQPGLNSQFINFTLIPLPSLPEQKAISSFLDKKTTQIDTLVKNKESMIDLLSEHRTAIINNAVTKGLDPNVEMKDSGVEWIGKIPKHWNVLLLKRFCDKITDGSHFSPTIMDEGKPYITVKDIINNSKIDFINCKKISNKDFEELVRNGCQPKINDVLLSKDGTIGKCIVVENNNDYVVLSSIGIIRPTSNLLNSNYLKYYLISSINMDQMYSFIQGSALKRLTIYLIKKLIVLIPKKLDQEEIVDYLDSETSRIDKSIQKIQKEIDLLKEYKEALISEAVTGKIKITED